MVPHILVGQYSHAARTSDGTLYGLGGMSGNAAPDGLKGGIGAGAAPPPPPLSPPVPPGIVTSEPLLVLSGGDGAGGSGRSWSRATPSKLKAVGHLLAWGRVYIRSTDLHRAITHTVLAYNNIAEHRNSSNARACLAPTQDVPTRSVAPIADKAMHELPTKL
jgi:hypothetical protein